MKNTFRAAAGLALVLVASSCGPSFEPKEFSSEEGKFKVMTPLPLKRTTQSAPSPIGPIEFIAYAGDWRNGVFVVGHCDFPPQVVQGGTDAALDGALQGATRNVQGRITSQKPIEIDGHPGRDFEGEGTKDGVPFNLRGRIFLVGSRLYQVLVIEKKGSYDAARANAFLESFQLLK